MFILQCIVHVTAVCPGSSYWGQYPVMVMVVVVVMVIVMVVQIKLGGCEDNAH